MAPSEATALPSPPRRPADVDDDFSEGTLRDTWVPHYLPHWTTPDRSRARVTFTDTGLDLRIDADQLDWRIEDRPLRVSNLQTGTYSGPVGSTRGTHRHRPDDLVVRTFTPLRTPFTPDCGRVDVTLRASADPDCMTAIWLVGTEHLDPGDSGELCVAEIDADASGRPTRVRCGIKAHNDERLRNDMITVAVDEDSSDALTWTVIWGDGTTMIGCEGRVLHTFDQAPSYPLLLMIDVFEMSPGRGTYPKAATIRRVRAWHGESH